MEFLRFNLHGNLIEFCRDTGEWSWSGWLTSKESLLFCNGKVEFKKIVGSRKSEFKDGETIVCLIPGDIVEDPRFRSIEDAITHHGIDKIGAWEGTDYWVGHNFVNNRVSFYDSPKGEAVELKSVISTIDSATASEMKRILDAMLPLYDMNRLNFHAQKSASQVSAINKQKEVQTAVWN